MDIGAQIRVARTEEIDSLVEIFWACFTRTYVSHSEVQEGRAAADGSPLPEARDKLRAELRLMLTAFAHGVLVAERGGRLVGLVAGAILNHGGRDFGIINDLCVLPEARRSGIGTSLVRQVCAAFQKAGIGTAFLESNLQNHGAHQVFQRRGFRPISYVFQTNFDEADSGS